MALLFNYSFNNVTAVAQSGMALANISGSPTIGVADGPQSINTLHCNGAGSGGWLPNIAIPVNAQGLVVGGGFKVTSFGSGSTGLIVVGSSDAGVTGGIRVQVSTDGSLQLVTLIDGSIITKSSASGVFTFGNRHEVEMVISAFSNSGTVTARLDGVAIPGLTAVGMGNLSHMQDGSTVHSVAMGFVNRAQQTTIIVVDSVYALDTTGSFDNAPLGPAISVPMFPNGVGQESQWTANGAGLGWQCLHEVPPDDDTTYISSNTPNQEETTTLSPPVGITGIYGVTVFGDQRQDTSGGGRTIDLGLGNGSVRFYGSAFGLGTTYRTNATPWSSNPFTSIAWALADATGLEVAAKLAT
jgi:hypothetical protein